LGKHYYHKFLEYLDERKCLDGKKMLIEKFGKDVLPNVYKLILNNEGLNFCKVYNEERKWCREYGIDYKQFPEEFVF